MNILFFGQGPRAEKLVADYIVTGKTVSWVLSNEQSKDECVADILNKFESDPELKLIKMQDFNTLRHRTDFHVAHICTIPMHSPVTGDPYNQPALNSILELIETVTMENDYRITVINSTLMAIGGNERALFGFSSDFSYVYMPFLPIDFAEHYIQHANTGHCPVFPTEVPSCSFIGLRDGSDERQINIPTNLYRTQFAIRDMRYLERLSYHSFSALFIQSQIANEIALVEVLAGNVDDYKAMVNKVAELTGIEAGLNPEIDYNHLYLSSIGTQYCDKSAYILLASAANHANAITITQSRVIMQHFNESNNRHIAIYGGDYPTRNNTKASLEIAGLLAQEIGPSNVHDATLSDRQTLPDGWDNESVFNVMISQLEDPEIPEELIDGSTDIDLIV